MGSRAAIIGGAALALVSDALLRRRVSRHRLVLQGTGLVAAAVIYPVLHDGPTNADERKREIAGVAAASAVAAAALLGRRSRRNQLLAAGWAAHALFDAAHHRGESSRLPDWYPAVCAGYDVATAAALLAPAR